MLTSFSFTSGEESKEAKTEGQAMITITDLGFKEVRTAASQQERTRWRGIPSIEDSCI